MLICILNKLLKYILIFRESNDELVSENQIEEIAMISRLDKRNRSEEEFIEDIDTIVPKRPKIIVTQCEIIQNANDTELIIDDNNMDINKSQADDPYKEIEEEETENALQEQDKQAANKEQSQLNIDINVTTENEECELAAALNINTEKQQQHEESEDLMSHTDEDKKVETIFKIGEEVQKSQDDPNLLESDDKVIDDATNDATDCFSNEIKLDD